MEYSMRRKDRLLSEEETLNILNKGQHGVMASVSQDNQPYTTPISYAIDDNYIYIHSALKGHKLDNIAYNYKVCFCVVEQGDPVFENHDFSTYFASAIVFGKAEIVEDKNEKRYGLKLLSEKYLPEYMAEFDKAMDMSGRSTIVIRISMDKVVGKAKKEKIF